VVEGDPGEVEIQSSVAREAKLETRKRRQVEIQKRHVGESWEVDYQAAEELVEECIDGRHNQIHNRFQGQVDDRHNGTEDNAQESSNEIEDVLSAEAVPLTPSSRFGYPSANVVATGAAADRAPPPSATVVGAARKTNLGTLIVAPHFHFRVRYAVYLSQYISE